MLEEIFFRILSRLKRIRKHQNLIKNFLLASRSKNIQSAKQLTSKYPEEPRASLLLAEKLFKNHEEKYIDELQIYNLKRKKYLKNYKLDKDEFEFIKPNIFWSIGNLFPFICFHEFN